MTLSPREFLFGRINYERRSPRSGSDGTFDLQVMRRLMGRLDHPESKFPIVHVAGTKGKGSTSSMIAGILNRSGIRTGLYTSPHLHRLEERFSIAGELISTERLDQLVRDLQPVVEQFDQESSRTGGPGPTFFEITTAIAFQYFHQEAVDAAVIEVGLGGRLDSTNVCTPVVSVITNIGMDHMHLLGDRPELIAREKAGIIKPSIPTVSGELAPEAANVIADIAAERNSPLYQRDRDYGLSRMAEAWRCWTEIPKNDPKRREYENLQLGMPGHHQQINAATAIATCDVLRSLGWPISHDAVRGALATTRVPGRIEMLNDPPRTILDIAHNVPSLMALIETLQHAIPAGPRTLVMGISREKDLRGMLACLPDQFDRIVFTRFLKNPRAVEPQRLYEIMEQLLSGRPSARLKRESVHHVESPADAIRITGKRAAEEWLIVAGSAFLAAECREILDQDQAIRRDAAGDLVAARKESSL